MTRSRLLPATVGLLAAVALVAAACGDDTTVTSAGGTDTPTTSDGGGEPLGAGPYPVADLTVTVEHPDHPTIAYRVTCLGDTATVTPVEGVVDIDERVACTVLARAEVQQRLVEGPPTDRACTEIYGGPDTATITGTLEGEPVDTVIDRANGCGIAEWDDLLAGLLPPAKGVSLDG